MSNLAYIPPYHLCEDGKTKIYFRAPTVADYRAFCGMSPDLEESVTTEYLNRLQDKEAHPKAFYDAINWTAYDRRTALYWIYVHTRTDTVITQTYECRHCQQKHGRQLDLLVLMEGLATAGVKMEKAIDLPEHGRGLIVPLRGHASEHIELLRNQRDEHGPDSKERAVANMDMRMYELAHCIRFAGEDESVPEQERVQARYDYLLALDVEKKFRPLAVGVRLALEEMQHGLETVYHAGEISLVTPEHNCPVDAEKRQQQIEQLTADGVPHAEWPDTLKEGNTAKTRLLLPFQSYNFFPEI